MKKNEDGTFTMNFNEARGSSIRCEEPGYVINQYEIGRASCRERV